MEQSKYQLFDGNAEQFSLAVTSNKNIKKVCRVLTRYNALTDEDRIYYAEHGGIEPDEIEGDQVIYNFENSYNQVTIWPALAEVLFYDVPQITEIGGDGRAYIPEKNKELYENLIRSEVKRGRDDFLGKFGVKPAGENYSFQKLISDLTRATTDLLSVPEDLSKPPQENIKET